MGYVLSTHARNKNLAQEMVDFLHKEGATWPAIAKRNGLVWNPEKRFMQQDDGPESTLYFEAEGTEVSTYYPSGTGGWSRVYVYALIRWVALRVGKKRTKFSRRSASEKKIEISTPVPYYRYDGEDETIAIFCDEGKGAPDKVRDLNVNVVTVDGLYPNASQPTYTSAALENLMGSREGNSFNKMVNSLGEKTTENSVAWLREFQNIRKDFSKPEIDRTLPVLWKEMAMLTVKWDARKAKG